MASKVNTVKKDWENLNKKSLRETIIVEKENLQQCEISSDNEFEEIISEYPYCAIPPTFYALQMTTLGMRRTPKKRPIIKRKPKTRSILVVENDKGENIFSLER